MTRWIRLLLVLSVGPHALEAQGPCDGGLKAPSPGGWGEYLVLAPRGQTPSTVRYAILASEERAGQRLLRFETRVRMGGQRNGMVTQILVPGYPYASAAIQDVVVQRGREPAVRWGPALLARARSSPRSPLTRLIVEGCTGATLVGHEDITVPAGAFRTRHYRNAVVGSDIWISDEVPFGLVKVTGADGASLELLGRGRDARSSVTGEPRVVNGAD